MSGLKSLARVTILGSGNQSGESKVVIVTGAAGDLGRQTAIELARYGRPAHIYIADLPREEAKKKEAIDRVIREAYDEPPPVDPKAKKQKQVTTNDSTAATDARAESPRSEVHFLDLDLGSFTSIRQCASDFKEREQHLDILILNAGVLSVKPWTTSEGYECHFGINYVGHALLSRLLIPVMLRTQEEKKENGRLVIVSSEGHMITPKGGIQFERVKTDQRNLSWNKRYGQSKLALTCMTRDLAARYPQLTVAAVHPGRIATGMGTSLVENSRLVRMVTPVTKYITVPLTIGIRNHLWAATSAKVISGSYYEPVGVLAKGSKLSQDESLIKKLSEWTDEELKGRDYLES
ncbi:NAD(P)-binding protein [Xylariaceae sp. FL0255]|nr:NAD(P)-binding protein [Xylariaceae sp. FL0255]